MLKCTLINLLIHLTGKSQIFTCNFICQIFRQIVIVMSDAAHINCLSPWHYKNQNLFCYEQFFLSSDRQVVSQVKSLLVKNRNILTHVMLTNLLNVLVNYTFLIKQFVCFPVKSIILSGQIILRKAVQGVIFNNNGLVTILCREFYTVVRSILY